MAQHSENDSKLDVLRSDLISASLARDALRFGSFTLKSGRQSPYFFNSGLLSTGPLLSLLASAYALLIAQEGYEFDVLFGPAYKGIVLSGATALCLHQDHGLDVGYAYNRKEVKAHGEGGWVVGEDTKGKRVLILDDVVTAGTAIREAIEGVKAAGGEVVGVVLMLDREELGGRKGTTSAVKELEEELGSKVRAVITMRGLMAWLEQQGRLKELESMKNYWEKYGIKE
ncbi:hypothetical protein BOTBODRAFT_115697 [Botryobasidium botryosum FD-172 SS1]|uniref:orotate phosphoribosyltransferase n=1 Tax=Botryobasidium botryosum (strain FD-172 SS1) TaxID=930990 RepID=A0A067M410_BOTB1|nr:hypothetical protein BOTBODRAFT_115697 [Botryobasidium botryosum FD-172 SS1]